MKQNLKPLFIFELANNHNGSLKRGLKIVSDISKQAENYRKYFDFAFKLQYRDLDTFIHPEYKNGTDIEYVKRFNEIRLSEQELLTLKEEFKKQGFISICTAFDEKSVDLIEKHGYDFIKIASCSFCDWFLLEKIADKNLAVIASTAGVGFEDIDKVVEFFLSRKKNISLMHCVAQYPTQQENLQLNQIDLLRMRYPQLTIGYSTHENPDNFDNIKMAIAKGARIFERHVGLNDYEGSINKYSSSPVQAGKWLQAAKEAFDACGVEDERYKFSKEEINSLKRLSRGVFALRDIKKGENIGNSNIFLAIPAAEGQLLPSDMAHNKEFFAASDIKANAPVLTSDTKQPAQKIKLPLLLSNVEK